MLETLQINQGNQSGDTFNNEIKDCIERLERVDKGIGLFEFGKIETAGKDEFKQFVFLLLAIQSYNLNNNAKLPKFFSQLSKIDITRLLKLDFKYYNDKALKTTENDVNKFDEEFKKLNLIQIHKDLKKAAGEFLNCKTLVAHAIVDPHIGEGMINYRKFIEVAWGYHIKVAVALRDNSFYTYLSQHNPN